MNEFRKSIIKFFMNSYIDYLENISSYLHEQIYFKIFEYFFLISYKI